MKKDSETLEAFTVDWCTTELLAIHKTVQATIYQA